MEEEEDFESTQGTVAHRKGKRGVIWGNAETSALIKVWGEAEIKYALSSLKRNYEIFEVISKELSKLGYNRSAEECRSKTKCLRKFYKQAVLHNNTSGSGRSKFLWFDEMSQIFRTDTSIHPLRLTESESPEESVQDSVIVENEEMVTINLYEVNEATYSSGAPSEGSLVENFSTDGAEASTSADSPKVFPSGSRISEPRETCNYEATLDPASRLALIQKRKQRASAAAKLDNTLCSFVEWAKDSNGRNEQRVASRDIEQKRFHDEVISTMKLASTTLVRLTDYITGNNSGSPEKGNKCCRESTFDRPRVGESPSVDCTVKHNLNKNIGKNYNSKKQLEKQFENWLDSESSAESETDIESLLGDETHSAAENSRKYDTQGNPVNTKNSTSVKPCKKTSTPTSARSKKIPNNLGESNSSPYLIVKDEPANTPLTPQRGLGKRLRKKSVLSLVVAYGSCNSRT